MSDEAGADKDRSTLLGTGAQPKPGPARASEALANGTRIDEFEILGVIGEGGFGIVYLTVDHSLGREVALKEYLPKSVAGRVGAARVSVRDPSSTEVFQMGLDSFINEARMLAQFDHPGLVKVHRFWTGNGTAYMVMPYYRGVTVREIVRRNGPLSEVQLVGVLQGILSALDVMHARQCFHRDVAPDNILLLEDERPVLLDFGAARRVLRDADEPLTAFLKPGYAPIEQYAAAPGVPQGAWTDLYALSAVAYFAITRSPPLASVARVVKDSLPRLEDIGRGKYDERLLQGLDRALSLDMNTRPRDVSAFREATGLKTPVAVSVSPGLNVEGAGRSMPVILDVTADGGASAQAPDSVRPEVRASGPAKGRWKVQSALAIGAAAVVTVLVVALSKQNAAPSQSSIGAAANRPAGRAPASDASHDPVAKEVPEGEPAASAGSLPVAVAPDPARPLPSGNPTTPIPELSPHLVIRAPEEPPRGFRIGQSYSLEITTDRDGYLYCWLLDDRGALSQFFPNQVRRGANVAPHQTLVFPGSDGFSLYASRSGLQETVLCADPTHNLGAAPLGARTVSSMSEGDLQRGLERLAAEPIRLARFPVRIDHTGTN